MMSEIGCLISDLTKYEVKNIYHDSIYAFEG